MAQTLQPVSSIDQIIDRDTERALMGLLMMEPRMMAECGEFLSAECFTDLCCRDTFRAVEAIGRRGETPDVMSIMQQLKSSGSGVEIGALMELTMSPAIPSQGVNHALYLRELLMRRTLWQIGLTLQERSLRLSDDIAHTVEQATKAIDSAMAMPMEQLRMLPEVNAELMTGVDANRAGKSAETGTLTGFSELDSSGGFHPTDLVVIAGDTSQGKSSLALSITSRAVKDGRKVAYYTLEMSAVQLAARLAAADSGVKVSDILYRPLDATRYQAVASAVAASSMTGDSLIFDEQATSSLDSIIMSIRNIHRRHAIHGAVLDYLQILNVNAGRGGANPELEMGVAARRLKNLAKELGIWIIALSQLSRNNDNPVPTLARLRASGQIAEAADTVILVYRPEVYGRSYPEPFKNNPTKGTAMINVAKGRNIGLCTFLAGFNAEATAFYPYTPAPSNAAQPARDPDCPF